MKHLLVVMISSLAISSATGPLFAADSSTVFGCNYTLSVQVDGQDFSVSHQDRVRNGSAIPFDLQDYLLQMRITEADSESVTVELVLSEKIADGWHRIYTTPPSFVVNLGAPAEFKHSDDIAKFDVALIVSKMML